jgi:hypothetical protein
MKKTAISTLSAAIRAAVITLSINTFVQAKDITIAPDVSRSNPIFEDKALNSGAVNYIKAKMQSLKTGDVVNVRFIGTLTDTQSLRKSEHIITHHNKGLIKKMMPQLVEASMTQIKPQESTNILAFFNRNSFDCANGGEVIVLTDGIEASEYVDPNKLLSGEASLPKPSEFVQLEGCTVTFYGIGAKRSDTELSRLRRQWRRYFDAAGATFKAIVL